jgi:signal transduction histidine kinase
MCGGAGARSVREVGKITARSVDVLASVLLGCAVVASEVSKDNAVVLVLAGVVLSATVAVRRRHPATATLVAGAAAGVMSHAGGKGGMLPAIVLVLDYYMVGRRNAERGWRWTDAVLLVIPVLAIATDPATPTQGNPLVVDVASVWAFFVAVPFAAGRAVGTRTRLNVALRASADRLEEEQRESARQAVAAERTRIARELHDVVAHSVSVMVIQTAAARRVAGHDRAAAAEALRAVESCGRDAMVDMRRMIGVLHRGDIGLLGGAAPGLSQLDTLAERARASGLPVQVSVEGEPRPLSAALDLVSYRVVQEALTNAMKHAGPARARVRVTFTSDSLELEIVDTGRGPKAARSTAASGQGLVGMRERLTLYGGRLETGRPPGGGFRVLARIPLHDAAPA